MRCDSPTPTVSAKASLATPSILVTPISSALGQRNLAIGDSGTTDVLLRSSDSHNLINIFPSTELCVSLPNGETIQSTHSGTLQIYGPESPELLAYIFPDEVLQHSLVSFSALCNAGCTITLTKTDVSIVHNGSVIFRGSKKCTDTLWLINLDTLRFGHLQSMANLSIKLTTNAEFVAFVHASFGSPPTSTFLHAARAGWLTGYPRISTSMITSNMVNSVATAKGHLDQTRQRNKASRRTSPNITIEGQSSPLQEVSVCCDDSTSSLLTNDVFVQSIPFTDLAHADLTGRFPIASRKGNRYLLVFCWDGYVHYEAMLSRKATAYLAVQTCFCFF